jgi:fructosamine-3-kinase
VIDPRIRDAVEAAVGPIVDVQAVGGGCISHASCIITSTDRFFLKWSHGEAGLTFRAEAEGLEALRAPDTRLLIPRVLSARNADSSEPGFILMQWIETGSRSPTYWPELGLGLAELHRSIGPAYGFRSDNFIGRIEQVNRESENWVDFFRTCRLEYQARLAQQLGRWRAEWDVSFERLCNRLGTLLPEDPGASLVHGDLWSGNAVPGAGGEPALIDPAVYYGHREVDLAMSELFGGFPKSFYDAYDDAWPVEEGYSERRDVYNLYHLINHLNHFGSGYAGQVTSILFRH